MCDDVNMKQQREQLELISPLVYSIYSQQAEKNAFSANLSLMNKGRSAPQLVSSDFPACTERCRGGQTELKAAVS